MSHSLCQRCKKSPATVHLTEIVAGDKREKHYCDRCAAEEGIKVQVQPHVPFNELLTSFVVQQSGMQQLAEMTCPNCGLSFAEFRTAGLLGCPHDYDAMEKPLLKLLERAHEGATHHIGKSPRGRRGAEIEDVRNAARLRRDLETAIQSEDFEWAARVRDELRGLEKR